MMLGFSCLFLQIQGGVAQGLGMALMEEYVQGISGFGHSVCPPHLAAANALPLPVLPVLPALSNASIAPP